MLCQLSLAQLFEDPNFAIRGNRTLQAALNFLCDFLPLIFRRRAFDFQLNLVPLHVQQLIDIDLAGRGGELPKLPNCPDFLVHFTNSPGHNRLGLLGVGQLRAAFITIRFADPQQRRQSKMKCGHLEKGLGIRGLGLGKNICQSPGVHPLGAFLPINRLCRRHCRLA